MGNAFMAGSGVLGPGTYDSVKITGSCKATGDIIANVVKIAGSATFEGNVKTNEFKCAGSCKVHGKLKAEEIKVAGSVEFLNDVEADKVYFDGSVTCTCDINADFLKADGNLNLNNVYGEEIIIGSDKTMCSVNTIEATKIDLINTKAKRVSGEEVVLDCDCEVEIVEYSKKLSIEQDTVIGKIVRL